MKLGVCSLALRSLFETPHGGNNQKKKKKGRPKSEVRDIQLVGRIVTSRSSIDTGSTHVIDQQQVHKADALGFNLYLHVL